MGKFLYSRRPGGGHFHIDGVGDVPLDRVWFSSHHHWHRISKSALLATGGLLRLSQGCFPARFPAHSIYVRAEISAPASVRAGRNRFVFECMTIHSKIEIPSVTNEPWINAWSRNRVCIWKFLVGNIVTGCIFCAPSGLRQGQVFTPQRHVPSPSIWRCPPPPPGLDVSSIFCHSHCIRTISILPDFIWKYIKKKILLYEHSLT